MKFEFQAAFAITFLRFANRLPSAVIPKHHRARTIISLGNDSFKGSVFDRMILNMHGEAFDEPIEAPSFRNGPAFQNSIQFQPEITCSGARGVSGR